VHERLPKNNHGREPQEQGTEDQVDRDEPVPPDEVLNPGCDERGHRERKAGDEHPAVPAHGPDRRYEDGRDRDLEDRMPEVLRGNERVGEGQEQERNQEEGIAHSWNLITHARETANGQALNYAKDFPTG